jgi:hypothetical protein
MPANENQLPADQSSPQPSQKPSEEKTFLKWVAPSRPFKRRNRDFYITVVTIASLFGLVVFLIEGVMPILLLISLIFLFYVMSTIQPDDVEYQITNLGILIDGKRSSWETMNRFWFTKRLGSELMVVETVNLPGRLEIMIKPELKGDILKTMSDYLTHEQVSPSLIDKVTASFSKVLPE